MNHLLDYNQRPMVYGSVFRRFIALLIDIAVLGVIETIVAHFMGHELGATMTFLVGAAYYVSLETGERQGTFGKSAMGLKVCDTDGTPISIGKSILRYLGKYLSLIVLVGYFLALVSSRNQTLHDMIAGTVVVKE